MIPEPNYDAIRRQVARRYRSRFLYIVHICLFILANTTFYFQASPLLTGVWITLLFLHTVKLIFDWLEDRATERAYTRARELYAQQHAEKPKRRASTRLVEDGEWVDDVEPESYVPPRRIQR